MRALRLPSLWLTWAILTLLTVTSVRVGNASLPPGLAVGALFGIAAIKADLVLENFMEAPRAERHWRLLFRGWIVLVTLILIAGFAFA